MSKRIDAEKQHLEDELKKLEGLSASSGAEAFNSNLTEEQEEWVHRKLPDDPFKIEAEGDDFVLENLTHEEWQSKLTEKYQRLYDSVKMNLPNLWDSLEFELSIQKI